MMVAEVETRTPFTTGSPRVLFDVPYASDPAGAGNPNYDVAPDGRFIMIGYASGATTRINVVLNGFEELTRRVPIP